MMPGHHLYHLVIFVFRNHWCLSVHQLSKCHSIELVYCLRPIYCAFYFHYWLILLRVVLVAQGVQL